MVTTSPPPGLEVLVSIGVVIGVVGGKDGVEGVDGVVGVNEVVGVLMVIGVEDVEGVGVLGVEVVKGVEVVRLVIVCVTTKKGDVSDHATQRN